MAKFIQEVPLIDSFSSSTTDYPRLAEISSSPDRVNYLEVVAKVSSGTLTVSIYDWNNNTFLSSLTFTETAYTRKKVLVQNSISSAVYLTMSGGTSPLVSSARLITLYSQNTVTDVRGYKYLGGALGLSNTTASTLPNPQYWKYNSQNYNGISSVACIVVGKISSNMQTYTVTLQEDDGNFSNWTDKITVVNQAINTAYDFGFVNFTPIDGRSYRISSSCNSTMVTYDIPYCVIELYQSTLQGITKSELVSYSILSGSDSGTGLQGCQAYYDSSEWDAGNAGSVTYYHQINSDNSSNSAKLVQLPSTDIVGSGITGANIQDSASLTLTDQTEIDVDVLNSTGIISASRIIAQYNYVQSSGSGRSYAIIMY